MGAAIGGIAQGTGSVMAADAQGRALENQAKTQLEGSKLQIQEQGREFDTASAFTKAQQAAREKAYQEAIATGQTQMGEGEQAFMSEADTANPELTTMEKDIASGTAQQLQQGAGQMGANLATQGVRGGAAATLMNRGTGATAIEAQKNINALKYTDSATREAEKRAYMAAKAGRGQSATLPAMSF
jgi:hypothetical protein